MEILREADDGISRLSWKGIFKRPIARLTTKLCLLCRALNVSRRLNDTNRHVLLNTAAATTVTQSKQMRFVPNRQGMSPVCG